MPRIMPAPRKPAPPPEPVEVLTIAQFCRRFGIGKTSLHEAWKRGEGPAYFLVGKRKRIRLAAARAWAAGRERLAAEG
jgi:hypothetical protein